MLLDRSPLGPKPPFDLHTLGTPLAFVLSQDQTLHVKCNQRPKPLETRVPHTGGKLLVKQKGLLDFSVAAGILPSFSFASGHS